MAIKLVSNYAKRLGLPGYSSHQFAVSMETELTDLGQVQGEVSRLYELLQDAVDREIQHTGFVPGHDYGEVPQNGNGHGHVSFKANGGNGHRGMTPGTNGNDHWSCSDKQRELIQKLVTENDLDRDTVEQIARDRFGAGVHQLNKLQASGLIGELLETCGGTNGKRQAHNGNGRKGGGR